MIEVNLLKGFSPDGATVDAGAGGFTLNTKMSGGSNVVYDKKDLLVKLVILFIPCVLLYGFEMYDEEKAKVKLNHLRKQNANLSNELSKYGKQVQEVKRIQEEKKRLDSRIKTITDLSADRLTNAKALNALHDLVPGEAWLVKLEIKKGKVDFHGEATEDLVVSQFLRNLQESIYFKNVKLLGTEEKNTSQGERKKFSIEAFLSGKNKGGQLGK